MSTPASPARQSANAANAHFSTGPRTEEGKARSSQNARKHGLTAKHLVVGLDAIDEFDEFLAEYRAAIDPRGPVQESLFDELVAAAWNLRRIHGMEAVLVAQATDLLDLVNNEDIQRKLERLARHQTRIERTFHRSLRELKALHTDLAIAATLPAETLEKAPLLASAAQIAKRTQALARCAHPPVRKRVLDAVYPESITFAAATSGQQDIVEPEKAIHNPGSGSPTA
jgi:hypothetical protein